MTEGDEPDDYFLVIKASEVGVQDAPAYEYNQMTNTMADNADAIDSETALTTGDRTMLTAPMIERDGYASVSPDDLNTDDLTGARVYGSGDEDIGEISELLVTSDGKLDRAVIDVGGFLGMGEYPVAVTMDELQIMREDGGDDVRVYIDSSQEALEAQPEYEG